MKALELATAKREATPWQVAHETLSRLARERAAAARIRARQDAPTARAGAGGQTAGRRTGLTPRSFGAAPRAALRSGGGNVRALPCRDERAPLPRRRSARRRLGPARAGALCAGRTARRRPRQLPGRARRLPRVRQRSTARSGWARAGRPRAHQDGPL